MDRSTDFYSSHSFRRWIFVLQGLGLRIISINRQSLVIVSLNLSASLRRRQEEHPDAMPASNVPPYSSRHISSQIPSAGYALGITFCNCSIMSIIQTPLVSRKLRESHELKRRSNNLRQGLDALATPNGRRREQETSSNNAYFKIIESSSRWVEILSFIFAQVLQSSRDMNTPKDNPSRRQQPVDVGVRCGQQLLPLPSCTAPADVGVSCGQQLLPLPFRTAPLRRGGRGRQLWATTSPFTVSHCPSSEGRTWTSVVGNNFSLYRLALPLFGGADVGVSCGQQLLPLPLRTTVSCRRQI